MYEQNRKHLFNSSNARQGQNKIIVNIGGGLWPVG